MLDLTSDEKRDIDNLIIHDQLPLIAHRRNRLREKKFSRFIRFIL